MEFYAGSTHTAKAVMHNPTTAPFDYQGILFMGIEQASMAEKAFHLEAGQSEEVSFPVVMPTALGSYPVYIGVFSGGVFLEPLRQGENVAVIAQAGPFNMSIIRIDTDTDKYYSSYWVMLPVAVIANPHSAVITHQLRVIAAPGSSNPELFSSYEWTRYWGGAPIGTPHENLSQELSVTLNPGQSVEIVSPAYYINGWHDVHGSYEWNNPPLGMYSAGARKKYWFRIIDEQGNWSPVVSIGVA